MRVEYHLGDGSWVSLHEADGTLDEITEIVREQSRHSSRRRLTVFAVTDDTGRRVTLMQLEMAASKLASQPDNECAAQFAKDRALHDEVQARLSKVLG
jgi:hypothetical protein